MRPCPLSYPPPLLTLQTVWWIAADQRVVFEYGEQQSLQLCQQKKRMACIELLNVHEWVDGGWGGGGGGAAKVFPPCWVLTRIASPYHP